MHYFGRKNTLSLITCRGLVRTSSMWTLCQEDYIYEGQLWFKRRGCLRLGIRSGESRRLRDWWLRSNWNNIKLESATAMETSAKFQFLQYECLLYGNCLRIKAPIFFKCRSDHDKFFTLLKRTWVGSKACAWTWRFCSRSGHACLPAQAKVN